MGPSKRKGSVRRPVLDLNARDDSPSRLTWQNKYQHVLPNDSAQENGEPHTSSLQANNPLSGLLCNYNSDSDSEEPVSKPNSALDAKVEDFLKEIHSIAAEPANKQTPQITTQVQETNETATYTGSVTAWQQCYDHNSGYPYYWNTESNEVTWEMPADLKAVLTDIAIKQQEKQTIKVTKPQSQPVVETKKKVCKYPWQTESDSEDEKIEMITSFGPQSGEDSDEEVEKSKKNEKLKKNTNEVGPQFLGCPAAPSMDPAKIRSDSMNFAPDDIEGATENVYGTSSLLTHDVQDTGPPGDESFQKAKPVNKSTIYTKKNLASTCSSDTKGCNNNQSETIKNNVPECSIQNKHSIEKENRLNIEEQIKDKPEMNTSSSPDDVIAQIEKETPPDYKIPQESESQEAAAVVPNPVTISATKASGIALIANYGDDSESEENSFSEKNKSLSCTNNTPKSLFPIEIPQEKGEKPRPLFPCVDAEVSHVHIEPRTREQNSESSEPVNNIYNSDIENCDSTIHKAFKRKKRLEFATAACGPSTSKVTDIKPSSPEQPVTVPSTQYNMDPNLNEHRGFGFSCPRAETGLQRKTYKNCGGIQFIKAETINQSCTTEPKEKDESQSSIISAPVRNSSTEPVLDEQIEDAASLLREKVTFLTGGTNEISPIQCMAIELETLVLAWQQGALTPPYLLRWLNDKCADLIRHEKTAAPSGWTCLWDRKIIYFENKIPEVNSKSGGDSDVVFGLISTLIGRRREKLNSKYGLWKMSSESSSPPFWKNKRYYYRNMTTKAIQWDYPSGEDKVKSKEGDVVGGGDEMDLCDTPPHLSPVRTEKRTDTNPSPPPPPVISDVSEGAASNSVMPQPPPPPQISFCHENGATSSKPVKKKKRKASEMSQAIEGRIEEQTPLTVSAMYEQTSENAEPAPPLPPMPPPPPPPPDEPPPPLIESPPPPPIDPDQPLPPGVDEPEYAHYHRVSPKHSYKKTPAESSAYSTELMMTYGYGLPVQQVVSSATQPIAMQMQPLEYHTYMHEAVSNAYLVQSAPTSHVIQCSAKKPKVSLNSELMSFYSDIAMLESPAPEAVPNTESQSTNTAPTPEPVVTVPVTTAAPSNPVTTATALASSNAACVKTTESATSNGVNVKKKKKAKATSGLALKKKGVSSLVAKWQQVQQEVRRDFSDDDDDITPTK